MYTEEITYHIAYAPILNSLLRKTVALKAIQVEPERIE